VQDAPGRDDAVRAEGSEVPEVRDRAKDFHLILYKEGATQAQEDEAEAILEALTLAYPGHPWGVRVYEGGFFIKHLAFDGNYGMNCKTKKAYSASSMKREVILMAGEWLERAGIKRAAWDPEQEVKRIEGVPEKYQPEPQVKPNVQFETVVAAESFTPLREEPRPQVEELIKNGH
jgi:hypothetical protein